jgi:hypothetical protein
MLLALGGLCAAAAGCGSGEEGSSAPTATASSASTTGSTTATTESSPPRPLRAPPCPPSDNCERASGEVAFVERVDPDGDGDAHFVLISAESITAPGVSVIDVRVDLRPHPLLEPGDQLAASGPVYQGSYGQSQIQADAIRFRRASG